MVPPVPEGASRQTWSVMIPTYDCAQYLGETLASVLEQDPGPERMQVQVVDDHSSDDPEAVVRAVGGDRVEFFRQPRNVGHVRNFDTCLARSRGRLVHLLHGDDRVRPGFYETMQRPFELHPEIGAAFCRHIFMDEDGQWTNPTRIERPSPGIWSDALARIATGQPLQPPAAVVRREVYEQLGGFDRRFPTCGEDWEMWVRIASRYPVWYDPAPLAEYRVHPKSLRARAYRTGQNIQDVRHAVDVYSAYVPSAWRSRVRRRGRRLAAGWGTEIAGEMLADGEWRAAGAQIREALRSNASLGTLYGLALSLARSLRDRRRARDMASARAW